MQLLYELVRAYPGRSLVALALLGVAGSAEGVSLTALFPLLAIALRDDRGAPEEIPEGVAGEVLERLAALGVTPTLGPLIAVVVAGIAVRSLLVLLANRHVGYTMARISTDLRLDLVRGLLAARWEHFVSQPLGRLTNAAATEATRVGLAYADGARFASTGIQLLVYLGVALFVSWKATLIFLGSAGAIGLALNGLVRRARRSGRRQTHAMLSLVANMSDLLQSVKAFKAMGREGLADDLLASETKELKRAAKLEVLSKETLKAVQQPVFALLAGAAAYVAKVVWQLPAATILVLLVLLVRVLQTAGKMQTLYQNVVVLESAYTSLRGTIRAAESAPEPRSGTRAPSLEREIRLRHVCFAYADERVLRDLSMEIPAGRLTAVVGSSGAGKTTILDLVIGLLRPQDGEVRVDGVPLQDLDRDAWRRMIGYVPQEALLLHDTVLHNVTLGNVTLDRDAAERALRAAGALGFVAELPRGIDTIVGERGARLSGGQRQRIVLARALAHEPKLLILDEATSALDPVTEAEVWQTLGTLRGRLTLLAITHRPELVRSADRVYRLEKGSAVEVTPEEPLAPAQSG